MRIEEEVYPLHYNLVRLKKKSEPSKKMKAYLASLDGYLANQVFFIGEQYSLADISLAPVLWRLESNGISTEDWPNLEAYMDRLFERPAFDRSLSEHEKMLRDSL